MFKTLLEQIGDYKKDAILTPVFVVLEVIMEVIIPIMMAAIIDYGLADQSIGRVVMIGLAMIGAAMLALWFGIESGRTASSASSGFAMNLRQAMYERIQTFSFSNIDKFSTAGLVMLYRLFRGRWKNLKRSVYLGLAFVPTFIDMLYQFGGVFGESSKAGESGGIGIGIGSVWKLYTDNIPLAVVLALGFPLLVLLFHGKEIKQNTLYRFSWVQLIVSIMELFLLYENGRRFSDANFSWGYMHGIFFVFVTSLILLAEDTMEKRGKSRVLWMQWLLYGLHLVCGIGYFIYIWGGNAFHEF